MNKLIVLNIAIKMPDGGFLVNAFELVSKSVNDAKSELLSRCEKKGISRNRVFFCGQEVK
jgi:hypothetical protein